MGVNEVDIKIVAQGAAAAAAEIAKIKAELSKLGAEAPKTTDAFQKLNNSFVGIKSAFQGVMGMAIVSEVKNIAEGMFHFAESCVDAAIAANEVRESFQSMTGSMEAAQVVIEGIQDIKDLGVFTRGDINTAAQALLRMGMTAEQVGPTMHMLSNYAAGTYRSLSDVVSAYVRVSETGEVTRRQLLVFGSQLGTEFRNKVIAGTASVADLNRALNAVTSGTGQYANSLRTRSEEVEAAFIRLQNNAQSTKAAIGEGLLPEVGRLVSAFEQLTSKGNKSVWQGIGEGIGLLISPITAAVQGLANIFNYVSRLARFVEQLHNAPGGITGSTWQTVNAAWDASATVPGTGTGNGPGGGNPNPNPNPTGPAPRTMSNEEKALKYGVVGEGTELQTWYSNVLDAHAQMEETAAKQTFEHFQNVVKAGQTMSGEMSKIFNQVAINEKIALENTYNKRKRIIMAVITDETQQKAALAALDAQQEARQRKMAHEQAIRNKAMSIMNAVVNTAVGVTGALSTAAGQWWGAIAMAALIGALGAAQVGLIAAQPIPEAAEGALIRGSKNGTIIRAGEAGRTEAVIPLENPEAMGKLGGLGGGTVVNLNIENLFAKSEVPQWLALEIDKALYKLQQNKNSMFGRSLS